MHSTVDKQAVMRFLLFSLLMAIPSAVNAHGYAKSPRSRNWVAHEDGKALGAGSETDPLEEHCHHCLNQGDTAQGDVCGITNDGGNDYKHPKNALGGLLGPNVQAQYVEGEIITIESVLTSHHQGFQVIKACPDFFNPTQACFDAHPLEFVEDVWYGAPKDENYPERGYFAPNNGDAEGPGSYVSDQTWGMAFKMKFKLPEGVNGQYVLLQWHYVTGNSCRHPGYDAYPWPADWEPDNMGPCPDPLPTNGANVPPEQFWNCMEVSILPSAPSISPAPTQPPVPTVAPTAAPTSSFKCCSQDLVNCINWCGNTEAECNTCGQAWITPPDLGSCTARWQPCSVDSDCCSPGHCEGGTHCEYDPNRAPPPTPAPTPPPQNNPSPPTPAPTPAPTPPTTDSPDACCTLNYKDCHANAYCNENIDQCLNQCDKDWLHDGPQEDCAALWTPCASDDDCCFIGLCINGQCERNENGTPSPTVGTSPTASPTTKSPTPPSPTTSPTPRPSAPPVSSQMFSTDLTRTSFEALQDFTDLHYVVQEDPPIYSVVAEGGAAGTDVVSEGQGYGLLISGITLASMDPNDPNRSLVMNLFYGYFNAWKRMVELSNGNSGHCQDVNFCSGGSLSCLPGWKYTKELNSILGTGSAPDGDADAITGMIFGVKAVANDGEKPDWFDEISQWADASATQFMYHSTVASSTGQNRIVKLGSCWGGWDSNGNNPSYHAPGSYRIMRDYQASFSGRNYALPNFGDGLTMEQRWDKLISTSYKYLDAAQCEDIGIVPNWLTVSENSADGSLVPLPGSFSGSGTPQYEFGSEASRTMWRVAFDAATYPCESGSASTFLDPVHNRLDDYFDPNAVTGSPWPESTLGSCRAFESQPQYTSPMGAWIWIQFMFSPVYSTLVVPSDYIPTVDQQSMVDAAGSHIDSQLNTNSLSYYHKSWSIIGVLTLNGDVEKASQVLDRPSCDSSTPSPTMPPTTAPPTLSPTQHPTMPPTIAPTTLSPTQHPTMPPTIVPTTLSPTQHPTRQPTPPEGCYSNNYKDCLVSDYVGHDKSCTAIWLPNGPPQGTCTALWGECTNDVSSCCEPAVCHGDASFASCVPPPDNDTTSAPTESPSKTPTASPTPIQCIICDDEETDWMKNNGKDCTTSSLIDTKCNLSDAWITNKFCRLSCYNAGNGYEGDVCCNSSRV